jgi:hypothetical protein
LKEADVFIQLIEGKIADRDLYERQLDRWRSEIKPAVKGYLGSTGGFTADGRAVAMVRFESEDAAKANSELPQQSAWWNEMVKAFDGEPAFRDCREVDTMLGGGSNDAGFVQLITGRAKDQDAMRKLAPEMEPQLQSARPDVLGVVIAWHGDGGGFTQAVYFSSEADARKAEQAPAGDDDAAAQFMALLDGEPTFTDILSPDID